MRNDSVLAGVGNQAICTKSRLKAWYLTTFRGRRIRSVYRRPILHTMGVVFYTTSWIVVPNGI